MIRKSQKPGLAMIIGSVIFIEFLGHILTLTNHPRIIMLVASKSREKQ